MNLFRKLMKNPIGLVKRITFKYFIGPSKYGTNQGYEAEQYWKDRFDHYGEDIKGPGEEGLTRAENEKMYQEASDKLFKLFLKHQINLETTQFLEVGIGNGYYTQLLNQKGLKNYTGLDITESLFEEHQKINPGYIFHKGDLSEKALDQKFDTIIIIDVIQHIVEENKLRSAMSNLYKMMKPGAKLFINPILPEKNKHFFYLATWSLNEIVPQFPGCEVSQPFHYREGDMVIITKN